MTIQVSDFLSHLKDVSASPLAYCAYICIVALWAFFSWTNWRRNIINDFSDDKKKLEALKQLFVNGAPPKNVNELEWYSFKLKQRRFDYLLTAFIATLLTTIIICGLAYFRIATEVKPGKPQSSPKERSVNSDDSNSFNNNTNSFNNNQIEADSNSKINSNNNSSFNQNNNSFNSKK